MSSCLGTFVFNKSLYHICFCLLSVFHWNCQVKFASKTSPVWQIGHCMLFSSYVSTDVSAELLNRSCYRQCFTAALEGQMNVLLCSVLSCMGKECITTCHQ